MEPLANNVKIEQFPFWQPVVFDDETPITSDSSIYDKLWRLGSWADQFASLGSIQLNVKPERINIRKFSFEENEQQNIPMWHTAVKGALYALSFFTLPLAALVIKIIFKWRLNAITMLKHNPNTFLAGKEIGKTRIVLVTGSLLEETTEAVVNAANAKLQAGGGICGAFHAQAGDGIFDECDTILKKQKRNAIATGEAVLTTAGDLRSPPDQEPDTCEAVLTTADDSMSPPDQEPRIKTIVHAVGPIFDEKEEKNAGYLEEQAELLAQAYTSSLELITDPNDHSDYVSDEIVDPKPMRTIGFPSISTGIYKFPLDTAAAAALGAVKTFIEENPDALDEVRFVFFPLDKDKQKTAQFYVDALNNL